MTIKRGKYYKIEDDKAVPLKKHCPRCGPGIMMAGHSDRLACGKCGYTEFIK